MYFQEAVIYKASWPKIESKHILLFSFVSAFHLQKGHSVLEDTHMQARNSHQIDGRWAVERGYNVSGCQSIQHHMLPSKKKKLFPKSFLSPLVVSDSDNHGGYKLSSVPLSHLSPRQQQGVSRTPKMSSSLTQLTHSVCETLTEPADENQMLRWAFTYSQCVYLHQLFMARTFLKTRWHWII